MASDDAIASFAQDGVAVIRSIVQPDFFGPELEKLFSSPSESKQPGEEFFGLLDHDVIRKIGLDTPVPGHAADFLDLFRIRLFNSRISSLETERVSTWRQDEPYSLVASPSITAWVVIDNIAKGDSPEFWAGSHLGSWYVSEELHGSGQIDEAQPSTVLPDISEDESAYDIRRWSLEPGDVLFVSSLTVYSLPASFVEHRCIGLNYIDTKAKVSDKSWPTLPDASGLPSQSEAENPLESSLFPVAWPQEK